MLAGPPTCRLWRMILMADGAFKNVSWSGVTDVSGVWLAVGSCKKKRREEVVLLRGYPHVSAAVKSTQSTRRKANSGTLLQPPLPEVSKR